MLYANLRTSCAGDAFLRCTRDIGLSVTLELLLRRCAAPWSRTRTIRTMQTELNTYSLPLARVLVTLAMTLVLIRAASHSGSEKALRPWALGDRALTMGLVLNISQGLLHHSLSQILAAGLMALGLGVIWLGVRAFKGASQPQAGPLMAALLIMSLLAWFHYVDDNPAARQASVGACLGLLLRAERCASDTQMTVADTQGLQPATLLGVMVAQTGMAGGFILMTHYRTMMALQRLSEHDALTGTLNRRSMLEQARAVLEITCQRGLPATLLMVDADHFKRINDEFGHQTGDAVLCHLVSRIRHHMRSDDLLGRFGGEEFVLLLPGLDASTALDVAERIRQAVHSHTDIISDQAITLSVSVGVAGTCTHGHDFDALIAAADSALYRAKAMGRNRVEVSAESGDELRDNVALRLLSQFRHNLDV